MNVFYHNNKKDTLFVGQLALTGKRIVFEYDSDFIKKSFWLSPFKLPLKPGLFEHKETNFGPIFGLFDDSLPDGWGLLLMDRYLKKQGVKISELSILDRLSFLGSRTMGALTYEPATEHIKNNLDFNLHDLSIQADEIFKGKTDTVLPSLMMAGGSPGGARPKVLVGINKDLMVTGENDLAEGFEHWIIKFNSSDDLPDSGIIEYAYSMMAKAAGIEMTETRIFKTGNKQTAFFGIKRFDRKCNQKFHVHTLGNLMHADYRLPSMDYEEFFKVIRVLTGNHQDLLRGFRQMVFNIYTGNRDDHVKNFAFIMDENGNWSLSPAYDMTFSSGPGGEHSMSILGEGKFPGRTQIHALGKKSGLKQKEIEQIMDEVQHIVKHWPDFAEKAGVSEKSTSFIQIALKEIRNLI